MELQWIEDFLALHRTQNFTRAADERFTTQSAFSRRVQRLEEWLGVELFERNTRPLLLTQAGETFLARALRLREEILDARRATLSLSSNLASPLRIFTTNTIATNFLPDWLAQKQLANYSIMVASITGCLEAMRQARADIVLVPCFDLEDLKSFAPEVIATDYLVLSAMPAIKKQIHISKGKLTGAYLTYAPGTAYGAEITKFLTKQRLKIGNSPLCESASAEALLAQVKAGLGAAWIPKLLLSKDIQRCAVPKSFDIPYSIVALKSGAMI